MSFKPHARSISGFAAASLMHDCGKPRRRQACRPNVRFHDRQTVKFSNKGRISSRNGQKNSSGGGVLIMNRSFFHTDPIRTSLQDASTLSIRIESKHEADTQTKIQGPGIHGRRPFRERRIFLQHRRGHRTKLHSNTVRRINAGCRTCMMFRISSIF